MMAESAPELVAPYVEPLARLIEHRATRHRWEAVHALSLVTSLVPDEIAELLPRLHDRLIIDKSVIVRDYATDIIANYAGTSPEAATVAFPILREMLTLWSGKQARHALEGLALVARQRPEPCIEIVSLAQAAAADRLKVVQRVARRIVREFGAP